MILRAATDMNIGNGGAWMTSVAKVLISSTTPTKSGGFTIAPGQVHRSELVGENARLLVFTPGFVKTNHRNTQLVDTVFAMHQSRPPYLDCEEGNRYLLPIFTMIKEECERVDSDWDLVESSHE